MKTLLGLIALLSISAPAGAALVELFGYSAPEAFSIESGLGWFVGAFVLLMFGSTYGGAMPAEGRRHRTVRLQPAAPAFTTGNAWVRSGNRQPGRSRRSFRAPVTL
jgi:hypothetical protein